MQTSTGERACCETYIHICVCVCIYKHTYKQVEEPAVKRKGKTSVEDLDLEGKVAQAMAAKLKYYADRACAVGFLHLCKYTSYAYMLAQ